VIQVRYKDVPELARLGVKDGDVLNMSGQDAKVLAVGCGAVLTTPEPGNYRVHNTNDDGFDMEPLTI
jgi:hypothetical protein